MPTYEYKCKSCNYLFDELQTMSEAPLIECPSCHTPNLVRLIGTGTGMIFKGSGFYLTDYKKSVSSPASSGSSGNSSESTEKKEAVPASSTPEKAAPPQGS